VIGENPQSGHLFVFRSRRGDRLKILVWDRDGFVLWYKRLEVGVFKIPRVEQGARSVELRASELAPILDGIDVSKLKRVPRYKHAKGFAGPGLLAFIVTNAVSALDDEWLTERLASWFMDSGDSESALQVLRNTKFQLVHQRYERTRLWRQLETNLGLVPLEDLSWLGEDDLAEFGAYRDHPAV
jgi:IS66 Orf2 like protein